MNTTDTFWNKIPILGASLLFIIGIFLALELNFKLSDFWLLPLSVVLILFFGILRSRKKTHRNKLVTALCLIGIFSIGAFRGEIHKTHTELHSIKQNELDSVKCYVLKLSGEIVEKKNSYKAEATIEGKYLNGVLIPHNEKTLVYFSKSIEKNNLDSIGKLLCYSKPNSIEPPKNPAEFNYKKYLSGLGIQLQFYCDSSNYSALDYKKEYGFKQPFVAFRNYNLEKLKELGLNGNAFGVVSALVLGQKDYLDQNLYDSYGAAGATHVLAVSGLHVGLIYIVLSWMCKGLRRRKHGKGISLFVILICLWSYAAITGFSPSVMRASTMFSVIGLANLLNKGSSIFNTIFVSAFILLLLMPNLLMEVGFQLSYSAVIGILILQPFIYSWFSPASFLMDKAWQITSVSMAAQLGTFPLGMLYFHQFPNYFMLSNLIVIPLATFILYLTFIVLIFSFIPFIAELLTWLLQTTVDFLNWTIQKVELLPFSKTEGIDISVLECFMLYTVIGLLAISFINKKWRFLKYGLGLAVVFFALQCTESISQNSQSEIMIHNIKKERAISILEGRICHVICSESLASDSAKIKFHLSHYWDRKGIKEINFLQENAIYEGNTFSKSENIVLFEEGEIYLDSEDVILNNGISGLKYVLLNEVNSNRIYPENATLVVDGKTKKSYRLKYLEDRSQFYLTSDYALLIK